MASVPSTRTLTEQVISPGSLPTLAQCPASVSLRLSQSCGSGVIAFHCCARRAAEQAAAYRDAGADLVILNLPVPAEPAMLEPLAEAVAPLA